MAGFCCLYNFIQLLSFFPHAAKKIFDFLFWDWFLPVCLSLLFSLAFANISRYSTGMEILLHLVSFSPPQSIINSFSHIQFSRLPQDILLRGPEIIIISCFVISFIPQVEFFWLKWYYDKNRISPIEAILKHKQVNCMRRKRLFTIFKYLDIQVFKICKLAKPWHHTLNQILFKNEEISQPIFIRNVWFFAVRFY